MNTQSPHETIPAAFHGLLSHEGQTIAELSGAAPLLVVFLRHLGCPFCRQTLADLSIAQPDLDRAGVSIALVHMADNTAAGEAFREYGLEGVPRFSDVDREAYRAMELGSIPLLRTMFGGKTWREAYRAAIQEGHGFGPSLGNVLQMPGVFVVDQGRIVAGRTHVGMGDRPDYRRLVAERAFAVA